MKRKMYWSLCLTSIVLVLLTAALILMSVYGLLLQQAKSGLVDEYELISNSVRFLGKDSGEYLNMLDRDFASTRVTIILDDGTVKFDSESNSTQMQNHRGRPEVVSAFERGWGEDIRRSTTLGSDTYYYAAKLDDNTVLRVAKQTSSIGAIFVTIIPIMAGVLLLILVSGMFISSRLTRRLLRPIEGLAENMGSDELLGGYEELEPFFVKIRAQKAVINEQVGHLRDERDLIGTITSNMKEGLILLDLDRNVLSVNRSALALLGVKNAEYSGKNLLHISRSPLLGGCVDEAMAGDGGDAVLEREDGACHIFASPVYNKREVCGAIVLLLDVTEQVKAEKIRRDFSANVSHELKTPLTSISGFAEMIGNGMVGSDEDVKKFAGRILKEASRLISLTDDIIRLSCIEESGRLETESVALLAICESAASSLRFSASQKRVTLAVSGEEISVMGNPRMLDELIYNLVDNAVKYNREGGRVNISIGREGSVAVLAVADTGIGISPAHQGRIFERFYRVDKSRSKQTGGTGLGLSIVKHIVERHGGNITLESVGDIGTTITIRIPCL